MGVQYPNSYKGKELDPLDGESLLPLFRGEGRDEDPEYFWEHEGNRAVRIGDWKLVALRNGDWELYDLESDPFETKNVFNSNPGIAERLMARYESWSQSTGYVPGHWMGRRV